MNLFHVSNKNNTDSILKNGLLPINGYVYLFSDMRLLNVVLDYVGTKDYSIFKVNISKKYLEKDCNSLFEGMFRTNKKIKAKILKK